MPRDQVVRHRDRFQGRPEHELAGVKHERLAILDPHVLGQVLGRLSEVDGGQAVVVKDAEEGPELQVDAGGLDHRGSQRLDPDAACVEQAANRCI